MGNYRCSDIRNVAVGKINISFIQTVKTLRRQFLIYSFASVGLKYYKSKLNIVLLNYHPRVSEMDSSIVL